MRNPEISHVIDKLYQWVTSFKNNELVKDTTRISCKYDAWINSNMSDPLSFTIFEMSDKGELLIDNPSRLVDSQAAFFLFVNTESRWAVAIKNTTKNQAKLIRKEPIENFKVKIVN
jgi:hypothetical protein